MESRRRFRTNWHDYFDSNGDDGLSVMNEACPEFFSLMMATPGQGGVLKVLGPEGAASHQVRLRSASAPDQVLVVGQLGLLVPVAAVFAPVIGL